MELGKVNGSRFLMIWVPLFLWVPGLAWAEVTVADVLNALRARDATVSSFRASLVSAELDEDMGQLDKVGFERLREAILTFKYQTAEDVQGVVAELMRQHKKNKEQIQWEQVAVVQREEEFKFARSVPESPQTKFIRVIRQYNGSRYVHYLPSGSQKQLDLWDRPPSLYPEYSTEDLNITLRILTTLNPASITRTEKPLAFSFLSPLTPKETKVVVHMRFDDQLALQYMRAHCETLGCTNEWWYFGHAIDQGVPVPKMIFEAAIDNGRHSVKVIIIKESQINPKVSDDELSLGSVPPWALVVDHRQTPFKTYKLIESPETIFGYAPTFEGFEHIENIEKEEARRDPIVREQLIPGEYKKTDTAKTVVAEHKTTENKSAHERWRTMLLLIITTLLLLVGVVMVFTWKARRK